MELEGHKSRDDQEKQQSDYWSLRAFPLENDS